MKRLSGQKLTLNPTDETEHAPDHTLTLLSELQGPRPETWVLLYKDLGFQAAF